MSRLIPHAFTYHHPSYHVLSTYYLPDLVYLNSIPSAWLPNPYFTPSFNLQYLYPTLSFESPVPITYLPSFSVTTHHLPSCNVFHHTSVSLLHTFFPITVFNTQSYIVLTIPHNSIDLLLTHKGRPYLPTDHVFSIQQLPSFNLTTHHLPVTLSLLHSIFSFTLFSLNTFFPPILS